MTFTVTGAVRDGLSWLRSTVGLATLAGYALVALIAGSVVNALSHAVLGQFAVTVVPGTPFFSAPMPILVLGGLIGLAALVAGAVVVLRLAGHGEREQVPATVFDGLGRAGLHLVLAGLLGGAAVTIGSVFFLLPGLFLLVSFAFYGFVIADGGDTLDGLATSWELASGHRIRLLGLVLLTMVGGSAMNLIAAMNPYATMGALIHSTGVVGTMAIMGAAYRTLGGDADGR